MWPTTAGVESTCTLMVRMVTEYWKTWTNENQAVVGKQDFGVKKLSVYTLKGEFDQGKLSVPRYKDKQKTKVNISLSRCRFPCVRGWNGAVRTEWRSLSFALRWVFPQIAGPTLSAVLEEACLLMSSCFKRILSLWWVQNLSQRNLREGNG